MKTEALEAITGPTMRPSALEAAARPISDKGTAPLHVTAPREKSPPGRPQDAAHTPQSEHVNKPLHTLEQPSTPFGQQADGTGSAAKAVEVVVHGMKVAVDGAVAWAEKKVEELGSKTDNTGPYASPATCAPFDLDPIASGVLPAMPPQQNENTSGRAKERDDKEDTEEVAEMDRPETVVENHNSDS